jgi:hydrogenase nickel incorporation protein HypA/HybF
VHELSVADSICRSVAERVGTARVEEMVVQIGSVSGVNPEALEFCLGEAAQLNRLDLGHFEIRAVPAAAVCECGHTYEAADLLEPCPRCGGFSRELTGGDEVVVSKLVVVESDGEANGDS